MGKRAIVNINVYATTRPSRVAAPRPVTLAMVSFSVSLRTMSSSMLSPMLNRESPCAVLGTMRFLKRRGWGCSQLDEKLRCGCTISTSGHNVLLRPYNQEITHRRRCVPMGRLTGIFPRSQKLVLYTHVLCMMHALLHTLLQYAIYLLFRYS